MDETPNQAPRRPNVYDALKKAVCDGLEIVRKVEAQNIPIEVHDLYPNLSYFDPASHDFHSPVRRINGVTPRKTTGAYSKIVRTGLTNTKSNPAPYG